MCVFVLILLAHICFCTIQIDVCISGLLMKLPSYLDQGRTNLQLDPLNDPTVGLKIATAHSSWKKSIWRLYSMSTIKPSDRLIKAIHLSGEAPKLGESEAEALVRWEFTEYLVCITVTQHMLLCTEGSQNVYCKAKDMFVAVRGLAPLMWECAQI